MSELIFITFGILAVFVLPNWKVNPYSIHRNTIFCLLGFGLFVYWLLESRTTYLPKPYLIVMLFMLSWWLLVSGMAEFNYIALKWAVPFILFAATPMILLDPAKKDFGIAIIVLTGVANAIYGILQKYFKVNWFIAELDYKPRYASGFISRGTNLLGSYLPVCCFLAMHLVMNQSLWWIAALPVLLAGLYATTARGGYVGLALATIVYCGLNPRPWVYIPALILTAGAICILVTLFQGKLGSLSDRKKYMRLAWTQFKRSGFIGMGFDNMKTKVPFLQRELNRKTEGAFMLDYHHPVVQKMHNDYVQNVLDVGLVGFIPLAYLMFKAVTNISQPEIHGALVAFLVCSLFIHLFYWPNTLLLFWVLMSFQLQGAGPSWTFEWSPIYYGVIGLVAILLYFYVVKIQVLHVLKEKMQRKGLVKTRVPLDRCLAWGPNDSDLRCTEIQYDFATQNFKEAIELNLGQIYRYDGDHMMWNFCNSLGRGFLAVGSLYMAKAMYRESLSFLPGNPDALKGLKEVGQIEKQLTKGKKH